MGNPNFKISIEKDKFSSVLPVRVAITHNGQQWSSLGVTYDELRELCIAATDFLIEEAET